MLKKQYSKSKPTCKVTFTIAKEAVQGAKGVKVIGDFNNWNPALGVPMKSSGKEFKTVIELPTGRDYQFRYLADNGIWENDWAADSYAEAPFNVSNSVVCLKEKSAAKTKTNGATKTSTKTKTSAKAKTSTKAKATVKSKAKTGAKKANAKTDTKAKSSATGKMKTSVSAKVKKDDLRKIEGIGPKIAQLLQKAGIKTFTELGKTTKTTLKGILEKAGSRYKMHDPSTWARQAKIAAKGDWAKLKQLQDQLMGGKKK